MTATRPLPGVFFRTEPAARVSALPRMDIAAFVGFAARGPLHTPVLIEDVAHLREVFGEAPLLAWDPEAAAWQSACLVPEVQDFFSGGGRRCWVVRVAGKAVYNTQPIAGLLRWDETGLSPAEARARCAGSWSDGLQVGASLEQEPLRVEPAVLQAASRLTLRLGRLRGEPIQPGDLLQLDCDHAAQPRAYLAVESAADVATPPGQQGRWQAVSGAARWFRPVAREGAALTGDVHKPGDTGVVLNATLDRPSLRLTDLPDNYAVERGDWLTLTAGGSTIWLLAGEFGPSGLDLLGAWHEGAIVAGTLLRAARLTLRLATRNTLTDARDGTDAQTLGGLAYCIAHPRAWSRLPDDEALYDRHEGEPDDAAVRVDAPLWLEASKPRFPLAGPLDVAARYLPLGLIGLPVAWRGSPPSSEEAMARDGLFPAGESLFDPSGQAWAKFLRAVHLDPDLGDLEVHAVLADAMDKRFVRKEKLLGLHSTVSLEEVSIVALPDASQRGWRLVEHEVPVMPEPQPPEPPEVPDPCAGHELFQDCEPADQTPEVPPPNLPPPRVAPPFRRWELIDRPSYDASGLIEVQESATKLAAARGDQLVVLGLPSHYRPLQALDHRRYLGADFIRDDVDASYATLYHPWYIERTQSNALRRIGPEGAAAGIMASRALYRGAWVAPANEVVKDALQIVLPASDSERLDLYNAGVNVLSMDPRGAVLMSSETLSCDPLWSPINVRRLIILLRRLCLREGTDYVFEPDSPAFRRRVNLAFEAVLADLFKRGAFAGSTPDQAFQVVTDDSINTEQSLREGRFIVELKVAPSQPMAFITVRLVQTGPGAVVVQQV